MSVAGDVTEILSQPVVGNKVLPAMTSPTAQAMAEAPQGSWSQIWPSLTPTSAKKPSSGLWKALQALGANLWCVAGNHIEAAARPFRGRKSRRRVQRGPVALFRCSDGAENMICSAAGVVTSSS
jgi:hypothetical protein